MSEVSGIQGTYGGPGSGLSEMVRFDFPESQRFFWFLIYPKTSQQDHWSWPASSTSFSLHKITNNRPMKNIQVSLAHQEYWPVIISHLFQSKLKPNEKERMNPSQQFTCQTRQALQNRAHPVKFTSTLFITLILYNIYTCAKEFNTINQRVKSVKPHTSVCLANISKLTGSHVISSPVFSWRMRKEIWPGLTTHHPLPWSERSGYGWPTLSPNFDARKLQIPHSWSRAALPIAAYISHSTDWPFNTDLRFS